MGWCDDPKSNNYNKLIYYPFKYSAEKLYICGPLGDIVDCGNVGDNVCGFTTFICIYN